MGTFKNKKTPQANKAIGRPIAVVKKPVIASKGVSPLAVVIIVLFVAVLSFVVGTRVEDYAMIGNIFAPKTTANEDLPKDLDYTSVERIYDKLRREFDGPLTEEQVMDGLKIGLAESTGDPYTTYFNAEQAEAFNDDLNGTFSGIGAEIGKEGEFVTIVSPLEGFPAEKAGLKPGDIILEIDGENAVGYSIEEAVLAIRGEKGTDVTLTIVRDKKQQKITVTRDTIVVPSVKSEILDGNIGYLRISRFAEDTTALARTAADNFIDAGVKGVILDLRGNSGGYLPTSVDIAGLWIDDDVVVEQKIDEGKKTVESLRANQGAPLGDTPTVVLIDRGSASASEIVTGALKDYDLATIMGITSYGKGSVQTLDNLRDGGVLKVTVAKWYTPKGNNIDKEGIEPDIEVKFVEDENNSDADNQLDEALKLLTQQ